MTVFIFTNDDVTAQYTHTLTVTGRLGGDYQCNVSNSKPSEAVVNFSVKGKCFFPMQTKIRCCTMAPYESAHAM